MIHYSKSKAKQDSKIGKLFGLSWELNKHRKNMLRNARGRLKRYKAKEIENFLNDLYKLQNSKYFSSLENGVEIANEIDQAISKYIEELAYNTEVKDDKEVVSKKVGQDTHSARIHENTIRNKIKEINRLLNASTIEALVNHKDWKDINIDVNQIKRDLLEALKDGDLVTKCNFLRKMNTSEKNTVQNIEDLDNLYKAVRHLNGGSNLPQIYGKAFERTLKVFSNLLNMKAEDSVSEIISTTFKGQTEGDTSVDRGELKSNIYDINHKIFSSSTSSLTDESNLVKINSFDRRQGKMDVAFKLPDGIANGETLRISAKSWEGLSGKDFGETTLLDAIVRTAGIDDALAYGLTVGFYNPIGKLWEEVYAHEFAKTCIFLDIVMGYSQKQGFADIIVIEDRSNFTRPIKVVSIYNLLTKITQHINDLKGITYSYDNINIRDYLNMNDKTESWYLNKLVSFMRDIKVSVTSGILK